MLGVHQPAQLACCLLAYRFRPSTGQRMAAACGDALIWGPSARSFGVAHGPLQWVALSIAPPLVSTHQCGRGF